MCLPLRTSSCLSAVRGASVRRCSAFSGDGMSLRSSSPARVALFVCTARGRWLRGVGLLLEVGGSLPLSSAPLETSSRVPMHTCVSPGGCPHSDLPSGLPVCSPTSLERPLWVAASRPLSLANLCPGSHSSHSVSPRPVPSPPTAGPASLARLSPWDSSEPLFVPGHPVCSVSRSSSSQCL